MIERILRSGGVFLALCVLLSVDAFAQQKPRFEAYGGYSVLRLKLPDAVGSDEKEAIQFVLGNILGWNGGLTTNLTDRFGITADVSGYYRKLNTTFDGDTVKADGKLHTFLFGPRVSGSHDKVRPFAQALFGFGRASGSVEAGSDKSDFSATGFAASVGGGVDFVVNKNVAIRAIQFDYFPVRQRNNDLDATKSLTFNNFRFGTGVVFSLGR